MTESDVAAECDRLARALGYQVQSYSDARKVRTCPGLPDRRYVKPCVRLWVETKAPGGKLTKAQHAFLTSELDCNSIAVVIDDPAQLLSLLKLLARQSGITDAECRRRCAELVRLAAQRGFRDAEPTPRRSKAGA